MNSNEFVYWLQGFLELSDADTLDQEQVIKIKEHLALVLTKVTEDDKSKASVTERLSRLEQKLTKDYIRGVAGTTKFC